MGLSLNALAGAIADGMRRRSDALGLGVRRLPGGATAIDCGLWHPGGPEAGLALARIALGGLAEVGLEGTGDDALPWLVTTRTDRPVLACLGSQLADWHLAADDGTPLLGSGPARALRDGHREAFGHREDATRAVLVLEGDAAPGTALAAEAAAACGVPPDALTLLHAPTASAAGGVQIAARAIECAVRKARHLDFPAGDLRRASSRAPVPRRASDPSRAMGRANDAIIYGASVHLHVAGGREAARRLADALPPASAAGWGRPFGEVFAEAGGDFGRIDPGLFSPAEILVTATETGETFRAGRIDTPLLHAMLGAE